MRATATSCQRPDTRSSTNLDISRRRLQEEDDTGAPPPPPPPKPRLWVFIRDLLGREGIEYLEIAFKNENDTGSVVDVVDTPVGQGFPLVQRSTSDPNPPERIQGWA